MPIGMGDFEFWHWVVAFGISVAAWEIALKPCIQALLKQVPGPGASKAQADAISEAEYPELQIPQSPHMEAALDPPNGLHWSNPREPYKFENDYVTGSYIAFHLPTDPKDTYSPEGLDYKAYFKGKTRLWEKRFQITFKKTPAADTEMFFGIELEKYVPLSVASRRAQQLIVSAIKQVIGGVYHTPGDDPAAFAGEPERPRCVLPLWAFDQFIITPEGELPPSVCDPNFANLGTKRYKRVAEYAKEIDALVKGFEKGPTYTFAFWGTSRFLDVINWKVVGIPIATPIDFDAFAGCPPVHLVLYSLSEKTDGKDDKRHVQSRNNYYFRSAIWSSSRRPERLKFEALTGATMSSQIGEDVKKKKSFRRKMAGVYKSFGETASCAGGCGSRPKY